MMGVSYTKSFLLLSCVLCFLVYSLLSGDEQGFVHAPAVLTQPSFKLREIIGQQRVAAPPMLPVCRSPGGTPLDGPMPQEKFGANDEPNEPHSGEISDLDGFMEQQATVQSERRRHLSEVCSKHPELSQGDIDPFTLRHTFVLEKYKILFCSVPKAACSNWKRVLMVLGGVRNQTANITVRDAHMEHKMKTLMQFSPADRKQKLQTYTKFMYARQPFHRLLSGYLDKFQHLYRQEQHFRDYTKYIMAWYRKNATTRDLQTGENITWSEWMAYLTNPSERAGFNPHWMEIHKVCSPCKVDYDYLGKLETVDDDAKFMLTSLGVEDKVNFLSGDAHRTNSSQVHHEYYGRVAKPTLQKLWEVYKLDFELFGYDKVDFL